MKRFEIAVSPDKEIPGEKKRVQVFAEKVSDDLWFHFNGETHVVPLSEAKAKRVSRASTGGSQGGLIVAPMPGKILKVNASIGQKVKSGDVLVVMEAMKMEYSLSAPGDGTVKNIKCSESNQVKLGAQLVEVELSD